MEKFIMTPTDIDTIKDIQGILDSDGIVDSGISRVYLGYLLGKLTEASGSIKSILAEGASTFESAANRLNEKQRIIDGLELRLWEISEGKEGRGPKA